MDIDTEQYLKDLKDRQKSVYDICEEIGKCVNRPTGIILGLTRGWAMYKLMISRDLALKDPIEWWKFRKRNLWKRD